MRSTAFRVALVAALLFGSGHLAVWGSGFSGGGGGGIAGLGAGAAGALLVGNGTSYDSTIHGSAKVQNITFPTNSAAACDITFQDTGVVGRLVYPTAANFSIESSDAATKLLFRNGSAGIYLNAGGEIRVGQSAIYTFNGRSSIASSADGVLDLTNQAANGFTKIKLYDRDIVRGTGTPEGAITANIGSLYMRTDGGTGTTLYVKESGSGNTGWVAVASGGSFNPAAATDITFANGSGTITGDVNGDQLTITTASTGGNMSLSSGSALNMSGTSTANLSAQQCTLGGSNTSGDAITISATGGGTSKMRARSLVNSAYHDRWVASNNYKALTSGVAASIGTVALSGDTVVGFTLFYTVSLVKTSTHEVQVLRGSVHVDVISSNNTLTAGIGTAVDLPLSTGADTLAVVPSITTSGATATFKITATTTIASPSAFKVSWSALADCSESGFSLTPS